MNLDRIKTPKGIVLIPVLMVLAFIIACGGSATSAPDATGEAPTPTLFTQVTESKGDQTLATPITGGGATPVPEATEESAPGMQPIRGGIVPMASYQAPTTAPAAD